MKSRRASDYWRRLSHSRSAISLEEFVLRGVRGISDSTLSGKGTLNVLCGANGTGKSTILESIHLTLAGKRPLLHFGDAVKFNAANLAARIQVGAQIKNCVYVGTGQRESLTEDIEIVWLNPGSYSALLQREFTLTRNFEDYLEGNPSRLFTADELKEISYLVCRDYSAVSVTEIEDYEHLAGFEGPEVLPFFSVTSGGASYRSEEMGIGEHALFLLYWYTRRIRAKSILFVEELETHISFQSQVHVLNDLVCRAMDKNVWIMLTTHSPAILERVPLQFVQLCHKRGSEIFVNVSPSANDLALTLGVRPRRAGVCIVEDAAAKAFLIALFQLLRRELALTFEVVVAGSAGDVDKAIGNFPSVGDWLRIVAVHDADIPDDNIARNHQVIRLPGTRSPELEIIPAVKANLESCAESLEISVDRLGVVLAAIDGFDEHDWFAELARALGTNYETAMRAAVGAWLTIPANQELADDFIARFVGQQ